MTTDNQLLTTDPSAGSGPAALDVAALSLIQRAEQGLVPSDLAGCEQWLAVADGLERGAAAVRWVAIAAARRCPELAESSTGRGKRSPWIEWVMANYAEYGNAQNIHHMAAVGDLLIRSHKVCCAQHTLAGLGFNKLVSISRLPDNLLAPFAEKNDLEGMNRDQMRQAVNRWLKNAGVAGEEEDKGRSGDRRSQGGKKQLDFLDELFDAATRPMDMEQHRKLADSDRVKPLTAAINGLHLVQIAAEKWAKAATVDESELEETIDELDSLKASLIERLANRGPLELEA